MALERASVAGQVRESTLMTFATPVVNLHWPDCEPLNAALEAAIGEEQARDEGIVRSNVGAWHSRLGFFLSDLPPLRELRERIEMAVVELTRATLAETALTHRFRFELEGWANVLGFGGYNNLHAHPDAVWSGVYYVNGNRGADLARHPMSGRLELVDPRPAASLTHADHLNFYGRFVIDPSPGQMIVFPGWMSHQVHPHFGEGDRISVAFNVKMAKVA